MDVGSKATGRSRAATTGEGSDELREAENQLATRYVSESGMSLSCLGRVYEVQCLLIGICALVL